MVPLLRELFPGMGAVVANGDDAAVVKTSALTAVTVDTQVEDVHFRWRWAKPEHLGARLVGVVLSDLAAMGALPRYGVLSLQLPKNVDFKRVRGYVRGVAARSAAEKFAIVGGDVTTAAGFAAVLTAFGEAPPIPLRRAAKCGDVLYVSGPIGQAGYEVRRLVAGEPFKAARWLTPPSRITLGRELARTVGVRGGMDVSDGLFLDARRMAEAAGLGLEIDGRQIPVAPKLRGRLGALKPEAFLKAIGGGEDYELLIAADPQTPLPMLAPIGRFVKRGCSVLWDGRKLAWPKVGHWHG